MYAARPVTLGLEGFRGLWLRLFAVALALVTTRGFSQQAIDFDGTLGTIPESICNAATFLQGPVGFAIVAVVFLIGLIRILAGNRGGMSFVITSIVIGLILIGAPQILSAFTQDGCLRGLMEEARVYRDDGAMRILFGLSVIDLMAGAVIFSVLLKLLPLAGLLSLAVSAAAGWFAAQAIAKARSDLPTEAIRQYILWLGQPDLYVPGPDEDARPLVYELDEAA